VALMGGRDRPVVMVGDSLPDAEVAHRAGVPFVLAAYGYAREPLEQLRPAAIIQRFDELPGVLEGLVRGG
jgi:phosphoglycolate phosphatase